MDTPKKAPPKVSLLRGRIKTTYVGARKRQVDQSLRPDPSVLPRKREDSVPVIPGMCDFKALYDKVVEEAPPGATLVEVGVWMGHSLVYLCERAREANKDLHVVGVDNGRGVNLAGMEGRTGDAIVRNLESRGFWDVPVILADSTAAARFFEDGSCWFVFIDADHGEVKVRQDIEAWLPKIARGGIIAGHDYDLKYGAGDGVIKVVDEIFGPSPCKESPGSWEVRIVH